MSTVQGLLIQGSAALLMEDTLKAEYGLLYKRHLLHERRPGSSCFSALGVCEGRLLAQVMKVLNREACSG